MIVSKLALAIATSLVVTLLVAVDPAHAANPHTNCSHPTAKIDWDTGAGGFPTDLLDDAKRAANYWEQYARHQDSAPIIPVSVGSYTSSDFRVAWDWLPSGLGYGLCSEERARINSRHENSFRRSTRLFKGVVAHEIGHVLGSDHVGGAHETHDGSALPIMTCVFNSGNAPTGMTQDDAVLASTITDRVGGYRAGTANSSFENYARDWGTGNSTLTTRFGGVDGTRLAGHMTSKGTSSYIYSTGRLGNPHNAINRMFGRANVREINASDTGYVRVAMAVQTVNYPHGETCGTPDANGWDGKNIRLQDSPALSWKWWYASNCTISSSWKMCDTGGVRPSGNDAVDGRIYVYNRAKTSAGAYTSVKVDRVRVLVDY